MDQGPKSIPIVFMVAGISSRFGGKIKQFAQVGPNNETLIEVSMQQAISAGFNEIIFVVGEKTEYPFRSKFGDNFKGTPIKYAKQVFDPSVRDRPWGTVDALVSAKPVIFGPFALCNGDDLYGENSFRLVHDFLAESTDERECVLAAFELDKVLPDKGKTNRGVIKVNSEGNAVGIKEYFDVELGLLEQQGLSPKDPISMNLFGMKKSTLQLLAKRLLDFKSEHKDDRRVECLLPTELGELIRGGKIGIKVLFTPDRWLGVTNPGDEGIVRAELAKMPGSGQ